MDKGTLSNVASGAILATGLLLPKDTPLQPVIFSTGMFALSGGLTNWLAVKMLFDRIPGLIGSGVIPARFREIRASVRDLILKHFFREEDLRQFFADNQKDVDWSRYLKKEDDASPVAGFVEEQWHRMTAADVIQPIIDREIDKLAESNIGGLLAMVGMDNVRPAVNLFVTGFVTSMQEKVLSAAGAVKMDDLQITLDEELVVRDIRSQVELLLEKKLQQLRANDVKRMMEDVMRKHLGWLVVWGNVFGGLMGVLAHFLTQ